MSDRLISLKAAIDAVNSIDNLDAKARGGICIKLMGLPSAQPDHIADVSKKVSYSCGHENDLVSRAAAIDAIKTWGLLDGLSEGQAIEILADEEKLPSAQPERKTGRWNKRNGLYEIGVKCSECNAFSISKTPYCPKLWCKDGR